MNRNLGRSTRNQNLINRNPEKFNWLGNAMIGGEDGAKAAQPAWIRFMQKILDGVPEEPMALGRPDLRKPTKGHARPDDPLVLGVVQAGRRRSGLRDEAEVQPVEHLGPLGPVDELGV